jgi:tetratricopeptide (TPR) repeat protein
MRKSNDLLGEILGYGPSQGTLFLVLTKMKEEGRFSEVIQECQKALSLYPDDLRLRTLLAESYLELGFMGLAETELARVTSRLTDLISAYKLQAEIFSKQQKADDALKALNRYLAHKPDDQNALDLLEKIRPFPGEAVTEAEKTVEESLRLEEKKIEEELVMETPQTTEDTEQSLENEIEEEDILDSVVIPEDITRVLEKRIEDEQVLETPEFQEDAVQIPPEQDQEQGNEFAELATPELAEIYHKQGQIDEALDTYELVIQQNPDDETSIQRLAELKTLYVEGKGQQISADTIIWEKKKKMITVLEEWLARIQELSHA